MLNEGAIMAAREGRAEVTRADLAEGRLRALAGSGAPLLAPDRGGARGCGPSRGRGTRSWLSIAPRRTQPSACRSRRAAAPAGWR